MDEPTQRRAGAPDSDFVHEVMADCIEAWNQGGAAAAEAVLQRHPDLAPLLRERLEKLQRTGLLGDSEPETTSAMPTQLGEFKLGKRIGSGGMGVVHLAEQLSLGRTVALKLVRPEQRFFPGARARFRREVEAIARLGDAGIVPIHCVGEDQGIDYFAMEFVRGASLGEVIAAVQGTPHGERQGRDVAVVAAARGEQELPAVLPELFSGTWVMTCCRLVARMARAAHHAHERGVVHRDLKPNNAMVTVDGRVLLLDFGLAAAAGTTRITRSGAMLGTLHYMAPEQLQDGAVDVRTDVYALGVTLHELLALQSPFDGRSTEALRQQILLGVRAPLREVNPEVPRDVATITAVASDRDPARRYASAAALADDLERFLQHRPIEARPVGALVRCRRWSQRHPALATAAGLGLTGLLALPFVVQWSRGVAEAQIQTARQQSQRNLQGALDAVTHMLRQARSQALRQVPGLDAQRQREVDTAVALMRQLRAENADDSSVAALFVRGMIRVAEFRRLFGDHPGALVVLDEAEPVLVAQRRAAPDDPLLAVDRAGLTLNRGSSLVEQGKVAAAAAAWQALLDEFAGRAPATLPGELRTALASCHNNLSRIKKADGDLAAATAHLRTAIELEAEVTSDADSIDHRLDRLRTRSNLSTMLLEQGDADAARQGYEVVLAALLEAAKVHPNEPEVQRELARARCAMAGLHSLQQDFVQSRPLRTAAIAAMEQLVAAFPDRIAYRQELGQMANDASVDAQLAKDLDAAAPLADRAVACHRELLQRAPQNVEYATQLAMFLRQRSVVALLQQRLEPAFADITAAIELQELVVRNRPDDPHFALQAAGLHQEHGLYHLRSQRWPEGRAALHRARDHYEALLGKGNRTPQEPNRLPKLLTVLARVEHMCEDQDAAMACLVRHQQLHPMGKRELVAFAQQLELDQHAGFAALVQAADAATSGAAK
ncbi:MAG: protein kinase [Planctomycetes bacterium]|jgi:serine/threonine protein kinase/tetratricopeptide (TPR) repeat protein|nr:protein kinase [Planctomycetota bacterium]